MQLAFVEFDADQTAKDSLRLSGVTLGYDTIKVFNVSTCLLLKALIH
jgi:hypothetical protein